MRTNQSDFDQYPRTPEQWEQIRQRTRRRAEDERTRAWRGIHRSALDALQAAVARGREMAAALVDHLAARAETWRNSYAAWAARRTAVRELGGLDDRSLKDLGLHRSEIESVIYGRDSTRLNEGPISAFLMHKPYSRPRSGSAGIMAGDPQPSVSWNVARNGCAG